MVGTVGWLQDTVDSRLYPTSGFTRRIGGELSVPGGNLRYYKLSLQQQNYLPLNKTFTLMLNGELGVANGFGGRPVPFWKNFYAGGIGSVRGFDTSTLGPRDATTDTAMGGTRRMVGNAELLFPMPGSGQDKSLRLSTFVDVGQVWGAGDKVALGDLRMSTGLAVTWSSFMGPLKFSFATPIKKESTDKIQRLQFQMGSSF